MKLYSKYHKNSLFEAMLLMLVIQLARWFPGRRSRR